MAWKKGGKLQSEKKKETHQWQTKIIQILELSGRKVKVTMNYMVRALMKEDMQKHTGNGRREMHLLQQNWKQLPESKNTVTKKLWMFYVIISTLSVTETKNK